MDQPHSKAYNRDSTVGFGDRDGLDPKTYTRLGYYMLSVIVRESWARTDAIIFSSPCKARGKLVLHGKKPRHTVRTGPPREPCRSASRCPPDWVDSQRPDQTLRDVWRYGCARQLPPEIIISKTCWVGMRLVILGGQSGMDDRSHA
ncbi:hypothetical protein POX_e07116 [Penicillium oxalicum]|uniref:Uncharacterized protein n=1 Tax=Penicillium oxalicum (strain 114-2 / CGMCC 5302) TaxID=933388 RepID=S8AQB2_PENO1|nr:hypothetical protein POX_e07116 [Penicillium oxalicum]EPS28143.1 hypothetical protein PDE_03089 [Penicillium oxalicum 114-2]KAI2789089.1 hypothetical protein POX_e07116 [Penicillium oxalicum]